MTPDRARERRPSPAARPASPSWPARWRASWPLRTIRRRPPPPRVGRPVDLLDTDPTSPAGHRGGIAADGGGDPDTATGTAGATGPAGAADTACAAGPDGVAQPDAPSPGDGSAPGDDGAGIGPLAELLPVVIGADQDHRAPIPWKTIWVTIGVVVAAAAAIELVIALKVVIGLIVVATFLAVVLSPAVSQLTRVGLRRGLATALVFVVGLTAMGGLGYLFVHPLYREAVRLGNQVPDLLAKTQAGKGPLGKLIARYHLQKTAATEIPKIRHSLGNLGGPALAVAKRVISGLGGLLAVGILTFLILLEGPGIVATLLRGLPAPQARRIRRIMSDVARSVTGYVVGNAATSVIAGIVCGMALALLGVPFAIVFAVWVAMVDLLPLVGGLLAGVPTVAFALLHSPTAGIITAIVFLVYQQVENHVLNPLIMSRTVKLNPLWVILSVVAGARLASIVGALLAIPVAGAIQVVVRDLWEERRARPKGTSPSG